MSRLTTSLLATAAAVGASFALAGPAAAAAPPPLVPTVTVTTYDGGVQVGASQPGQPLIGASAGTGGVCFGISLQMEHCVSTAAVTDAIQIQLP